MENLFFFNFWISVGYAPGRYTVWVVFFFFLMTTLGYREKRFKRKFFVILSRWSLRSEERTTRDSIVNSAYILYIYIEKIYDESFRRYNREWKKKKETN